MLLGGIIYVSLYVFRTQGLSRNEIFKYSASYSKVVFSADTYARVSSQSNTSLYTGPGSENFATLHAIHGGSMNIACLGGNVQGARTAELGNSLEKSKYFYVGSSLTSMNFVELFDQNLNKISL